MCDIMQELVDEVLDDERVGIATNLLKEGNIPLSTIARCSKLPLEKVEKLASELEQLV